MAESKIETLLIDNVNKRYEINGTPLPKNCNYLNLTFNNGAWDLTVGIHSNVEQIVLGAELEKEKQIQPEKIIEHINKMTIENKESPLII